MMFMVFLLWVTGLGSIRKMSTNSSENVMATLARTWPFLCFFAVLLVSTTTTVSSAATTGQSTDGSVQNLRLLSIPQLNHDIASLAPVAASTTGDGIFAKSRKARDVSRVDPGGEDDLTSASAAAALGQDYTPPARQSSKAKTLYPPLSGSGELFRLFRPLALTPDKTIGMTRWYLPGFGYFNRGGRAASSNFIRFGRSGAHYFDDDEALNGGGDVSMLNRNNAKKKNNFIRLGRENPRQTNFIRLGRSGPPSQGEFFNSGYITPALSDPFREEEA